MMVDILLAYPDDGDLVGTGSCRSISSVEETDPDSQTNDAFAEDAVTRRVVRA